MKLLELLEQKRERISISWRLINIFVKPFHSIPRSGSLIVTTKSHTLLLSNSTNSELKLRSWSGLLEFFSERRYIENGFHELSTIWANKETRKAASFWTCFCVFVCEKKKKKKKKNDFEHWSAETNKINTKKQIDIEQVQRTNENVYKKSDKHFNGEIERGMFYHSFYFICPFF